MLQALACGRGAVAKGKCLTLLFYPFIFLAFCCDGLGFFSTVAHRASAPLGHQHLGVEATKTKGNERAAGAASLSSSFSSSWASVENCNQQFKFKHAALAFFAGRVRVFFRNNAGYVNKGVFELPHGQFKKQRWKREKKECLQNRERI